MGVLDGTHGYSSLRRQSLQQVNPLGPLSVLRSLHGPHVLGQGNRKLIFRNKIKGTLR
jgi:hypothetical protein